MYLFWLICYRCRLSSFVGSGLLVIVVWIFVVIGVFICVFSNIWLFCWIRLYV